MSLWRVILLLVLTVVLPVRGALALNMGMSMDTPIETPQSGVHSAALAKTEVPCPHHVQADAPTAPASVSQNDMGDHSSSAHTHLLCDVCNVLALSVSIPATERADIQPTHAPQGSERFSSVVLPIGHKPPIPV